MKLSNNYIVIYDLYPLLCSSPFRQYFTDHFSVRSGNDLVSNVVAELLRKMWTFPRYCFVQWMFLKLILDSEITSLKSYNIRVNT